MDFGKRKSYIWNSEILVYVGKSERKIRMYEKNRMYEKLYVLKSHVSKIVCVKNRMYGMARARPGLARLDLCWSGCVPRG